MPKREEMYKFDEQKFLLDGLKVYAIRVSIEEAADRLAGRQFSNLVLTGVGGTTAELHAVRRIVEIYSDIPVHLLNAAEARACADRRITKDSLLITASKSGDTKETVEICRYARDLGATWSLAARRRLWPRRTVRWRKSRTRSSSRRKREWKTRI